MANRQAFLPSLSKSGLFFSKDFQRKLWRFWGISRTYKGSKPKGTTSKFFRRPLPPFGPTSDAIEPYSRDSAAREGSSASRAARESLLRTVADGGFIVEHPYGLVEVSI